MSGGRGEEWLVVAFCLAPLLPALAFFPDLPSSLPSFLHPSSFGLTSSSWSASFTSSSYVGHHRLFGSVLMCGVGVVCT
jgi:hypothetical protein